MEVCEQVTSFPQYIEKNKPDEAHFVDFPVIRYNPPASRSCGFCTFHSDENGFVPHHILSEFLQNCIIIILILINCYHDPHSMKAVIYTEMLGAQQQHYTFSMYDDRQVSKDNLL
jgi:hypothetical protein